MPFVIAIKHLAKVAIATITISTAAFTAVSVAMVVLVTALVEETKHVKLVGMLVTKAILAVGS